MVRKKLLASGWKPYHAEDSDTCSEGDTRCAGRPEMHACSGSGAASCEFLWRKGQVAVAIVTVGEDVPRLSGAHSYQVTPTEAAPSEATVGGDLQAIAGAWRCSATYVETYFRDGTFLKHVQPDSDTEILVAGRVKIVGGKLTESNQFNRWLRVPVDPAPTEMLQWSRAVKGNDWTMESRILSVGGSTLTTRPERQVNSDGSVLDLSKATPTTCARVREVDEAYRKVRASIPTNFLPPLSKSSDTQIGKGAAAESGGSPKGEVVGAGDGVNATRPANIEGLCRYTEDSATAIASTVSAQRLAIAILKEAESREGKCRYLAQSQETLVSNTDRDLVSNFELYKKAGQQMPPAILLGYCNRYRIVIEGLHTVGCAGTQ
ncbi:MAG TPA: hypothetical protein VN782_15955 [Usitatibacter sp.]|nr:hypothetical protein [Usitatibacter sp.]